MERICATLNRLNPYDKEVVEDILKIELCNYDRKGKPRNSYGVVISAKRYVVYARQKSKIQIIKLSEHGLGMLYLPDKRKRYIPTDCKDRRPVIHAGSSSHGNGFWRTISVTSTILQTRW